MTDHFLSWFQPLSEPVRSKARLLPLENTVEKANPEVEVMTLDKWWVDLDVPPEIYLPRWRVVTGPLKARDGPEERDPTLPNNTGFLPLNEPPAFLVPPRPVDVGFFVTEIFTEPPPPGDADKLEPWFQPLQEPDRSPKLALLPLGLKAKSLPDGADKLEPWFQPLQEPVRPPLRLTHGEMTIDPIAFLQGSPAPAPDFGWFRGLEQPTLPPDRAAVGESLVDPDLLTRPEATSLDKWHSPLGVPTLPPDRVAHTQFVFIEPDDTLPRFEWYIDLDVPVLPPKRLVAEEFEIDPDLLTRPEVTTLDKWHQPLSEPVRVRAPIVGEGWTVVDPQGDFPQELVEWHQPLQEPVIPPVRLVAEEFEVDPDLLTRPEVTTLDKWHQPLSEPVRTRAPLAQEGWTVIDPQGDFPQEVIEWHQPLQEPVRPPVRLVAEEFEVDADLLTRPEATTLDRWHQPLAEPVRTKAPLAPEGYYALDPKIDFEPPVDDPRRYVWIQPLSLPVLPPARLVGEEFIVDPDLLTRPEVTTLDKWFQPLSEPVRVPQPLVPEGLFAPDAKIDFALPVPMDSWWSDLALPTLPQSRLVPEAFSWDLEQIAPPLDTWLEPLQQPLFDHLRLVGEAYVSDPLPPPEDISLDKWHRPLEQPLFDHLRLVPEEYEVDPTVLLLAENITLDKWYSDLAVPVLPPKRLVGEENVFGGEPSLFSGFISGPAIVTLSDGSTEAILTADSDEAQISLSTQDCADITDEIL